MNSHRETFVVGGEAERLVNWSGWQPHEQCWREGRLPRLPGLYRIRRAGRADVDYIGQTGLTLRERQGMLRGVYAAEMPYRDPHTAGSALWAMRHATGCAFEVAVAPFTGPYAMRLGLEAVAIAEYRQAGAVADDPVWADAAGVADVDVE